MRVGLAAFVLVMLAAVAWAPVVHAGTDFSTFAFPYVQTDPAGDATPATSTWADYTEFAATTTEDGTMVLRETFGAFASAVGENSYTLVFKVADTQYQSSWTITWAGGTAAQGPTSVNFSPAGGASYGKSVGTATLDTAHNFLLIAIPAADVGAPADGADVSFSVVATGNVVGVVSTTADTLTVSGDYAYGLGKPVAAGTEVLAITATKSSAAAVPGGEAKYDLKVTNLGAVNTNFTLSALNLPAGYVATFAPPKGAIAVNATTPAALAVKIPANAKSTTHLTFQAKVVGAKGANKTVDLTLDVTTPGSASSSTSAGPGGSGGPGPTSGGDNGGGDGGTTTDENGNVITTKKSPGIEFLANVLAVGLVVVAMRRRAP